MFGEPDQSFHVKDGLLSPDDFNCSVALNSDHFTLQTSPQKASKTFQRSTSHHSQPPGESKSNLTYLYIPKERHGHYILGYAMFFGDLQDGDPLYFQHVLGLDHVMKGRFVCNWHTQKTVIYFKRQTPQTDAFLCWGLDSGVMEGCFYVVLPYRGSGEKFVPRVITATTARAPLLNSSISEAWCGGDGNGYGGEEESETELVAIDVDCCVEVRENGCMERVECGSGMRGRGKKRKRTNGGREGTLVRKRERYFEEMRCVVNGMNDVEDEDEWSFWVDGYTDMEEEKGGSRGRRQGQHKGGMLAHGLCMDGLFFCQYGVQESVEPISGKIMSRSTFVVRTEARFSSEIKRNKLKRAGARLYYANVLWGSVDETLVFAEEEEVAQSVRGLACKEGRGG